MSAALSFCPSDSLFLHAYIQGQSSGNNEQPQDQRRKCEGEYLVFGTGIVIAFSTKRPPSSQVINHSEAAEQTPVSVAPTGHDDVRIRTQDERSGAGNKSRWSGSVLCNKERKKGLVVSLLIQPSGRC